MARNRMIKPDFFESKKLSSVSLESNLLFIGLWIYGDDYGVCDYSIRTILGDIYRHRESVSENNVKKWLSELFDVGVIIHAEVNTRPYIIVKSWEEHQCVANPSKRRYLDDETINKIIDLFREADKPPEGYVESNEGLIRVYVYNKKEKENKKEKKKEKEKEDSFVVPTFEEYENYCKQHGFENIAQRSFKAYSEGNWHDSHGNKIKNWKQKLQIVWFREENKSKVDQKKKSLWEKYKEQNPDATE